MIHWNKKRYGHSGNGRKLVYSTDWSGNAISNEGGDDTHFHLEQYRGNNYRNFHSPFDVKLIKKKRNNKRMSKEHKDKLKTLQKIGLVTSW